MIPALSLLFSWVHPSLAWFIFGFILFLVELIVPGFIIFFFGMGAWFVSLLLLVTDVDHITQLALFTVSSVVFLIVFRSRLGRILNEETDRASARVEQDLVGRRLRVTEAIAPDRPGRVSLNGVEWSAQSAEVIAVDAVVEVIAHESITLVVRAAPPR